MTERYVIPRQARLSVVLPAYREAENLQRLLPALMQQLAALVDNYEIIVVNDGSPDHTEQLMLSLPDAWPVHYLSLSRNFGKEAALTAGLDVVRGDAVILMDADFQHPLAVLPEFFQKWLQGYDMVYAVRDSRDNESWLKRHGTRMFYALMSQGSEVEITPDAGDFRILDRRVVEALRQLPERNRFMKGMYAWVGFRSLAIPYVPDERIAGDSTFGMAALFRLAFTGLTAFTNLPLRIWSAIGTLVSLGALAYGMIIVVSTLLFGKDVPGYATIVTSIMFFSGIQLLSVGVLGEYLARVYTEVKQRPPYLIGNQRDHSPLSRLTADVRDGR